MHGRQAVPAVFFINNTPALIGSAIKGILYHRRCASARVRDIHIPSAFHTAEIVVVPADDARRRIRSIVIVVDDQIGLCRIDIGIGAMFGRTDRVVVVYTLIRIAYFKPVIAAGRRAISIHVLDGCGYIKNIFSAYGAATRHIRLLFIRFL